MNLDDQRFLKKLGARVRARRQARGLSQLELGRLCELHRTFVGSVERGERNISLLNLRLVARALRTRIGELLEGVE